MPVVSTRFSATPGLAKAIGRHGVYQTCACGFIFPVYKGRYPQACPSCGSPIPGRGATADVAPVDAMPTNESMVSGDDVIAVMKPGQIYQWRDIQQALKLPSPKHMKLHEHPLSKALTKLRDDGKIEVIKTVSGFGEPRFRLKESTDAALESTLQFFAGNKVKFKKGEYEGKTGAVQSIIQKRYSKEDTVYRVQIDGFPKPGGWNGLVTATAEFLERIPD